MKKQQYGGTARTVYPTNKKTKGTLTIKDIKKALKSVRKTNTMTYGDGTGLFYKGEEVLRQPTTTATAYFQHMYWTNDFSNNPNRKRRHGCLMNGYWCWQNLKEHPFDLLKYVNAKVS